MQTTETAKFALVIEFNNIGEIIDQGVERNGARWYRTNTDGVRESHELQFLNTPIELAACINKINAYFPPSAIESVKKFLIDAISLKRKEHAKNYPEIDISLPYREGERESLAEKTLLYSALNTIIRNARKK